MVLCTSVPQSTCASDRRCIFLVPEAFPTHSKQTHHGARREFTGTGTSKRYVPSDKNLRSLRR